MLENFNSAVVSTGFTDVQIEAFFWELVDYFKSNEQFQRIVCDALELLDTHRPELAKKLAHEILEVVTA